MARLVFGMNQSLDGYVDQYQMAFAPSPTLFRHFIEVAPGTGGQCLRSPKMYEVMRYWDDDHPEWDAGGTRPPAGVAEPAEMGRLALVEVGRPQRQACRG